MAQENLPFNNRFTKSEKIQNLNLFGYGHLNHTQRWIGAYYRNTNVLIQFIRTIVYYSNSTGFVDVITICFLKKQIAVNFVETQ